MPSRFQKVSLHLLKNQAKPVEIDNLAQEVGHPAVDAGCSISPRCMTSLDNFSVALLYKVFPSYRVGDRKRNVRVENYPEY